MDWFAEEERCYAFLERLRWREGFICPHCGARESYWQASRGRRRCTACRKDTSVAIERGRHQHPGPREELMRKIWELCRAKERAIEAQEFENAAGLRDQELKLRRQADAEVVVPAEVLREIHRHLGIPAPDASANRPRTARRALPGATAHSEALRQIIKTGTLTRTSHQGYEHRRVLRTDRPRGAQRRPLT